MDRAVLVNLFTTNNWQQHFKDCIEEGMEVDSSSFDDGWTLLHYACDAENFEAMTWLLKHGADINAQDDHGWTVLHHAVETDIEFAIAANLDVEFRGAKFLLEQGADTQKQDQKGCTPRDVVAGFGETILNQYDALVKDYS